MDIINVEMKEIHNIIGNKLKENLLDFKFNKAKKQMQRDNKIKIDIIKWNAAKYVHNKHLLLSFTIFIRHKIIDRLYEELFNCKPETEEIIWFNDDNKLYGNGKTSFDIKTIDELNKIMEKMADYYKDLGNNFFNKFNTDNDFYEYTCINRKLDAWSQKPALKRIMLCYLVDKNNINQIHKYNIECCTSVPSGTDFYISEYYKGIKILNEYYGKIIIE